MTTDNPDLRHARLTLAWHTHQLFRLLADLSGVNEAMKV